MVNLKKNRKREREKKNNNNNNNRKKSMRNNRPTILHTNKNNINANGFIIPASSSVLEPAT